jgi:hypothetical protein
MKKMQPSCPGSRDLNWTGKGLKQKLKKCKDFEYTASPLKQRSVVQWATVLSHNNSILA